MGIGHRTNNFSPFMALFHKYGTRSNEIRRAKKDFFLKLKLVLLAGLVLILFFLLAKLGPPSCSRDRFEFASTETVDDPVDTSVFQQRERELRSEIDSLDSDSNRAEAIERLQELLSVREELDRYPSSRNAPETQRLQRQLSGWQSQPLADAVERYVEAGREAAQAGDGPRAAEAYATAIELQQQLHREYRQSPHASLSQLQIYQRERAAVLATMDAPEEDPDTTASREQQLRQEIHRQGAALQEALRNGDRDSIVLKTAQLQRQIESYNARFADALPLNAALVGQIQFLMPIRNEVTLLQKLILQRLNPLPETPEVQLLTVEVWQDLYERLTGQNPSQNRGPRLPVDSVSNEDALQFCQRMGWLLGRTVDLPSVQDLEVALGNPPSMTALDRIAVHALSNQREPLAVASKVANENGFYDLLGNIAEWTRSQDGESAVVWGGSARDSAALLSSVPSETRRLNDRNRTTGFRIKVSFINPL